MTATSVTEGLLDSTAASTSAHFEALAVSKIEACHVRAPAIERPEPITLSEVGSPSSYFVVNLSISPTFVPYSSLSSATTTNDPVSSSGCNGISTGVGISATIASLLSKAGVNLMLPVPFPGIVSFTLKFSRICVGWLRALGMFLESLRLPRECCDAKPEGLKAAGSLSERRSDANALSGASRLGSMSMPLPLQAKQASAKNVLCMVSDKKTDELSQLTGLGSHP
mmetsp:Transcript_151456/g.282344  ORF Transcript_151456/g.282344 Transcript_151456/m.282344 type:complete len:225 (+) Transcript_151456:69-743(+)